MDPKNTVALASIASLYLNQKQFDEAQKWYEKLTVVDPSSTASADAYYEVSVFHRLVEVVSGVWGCPRQTRHEAGRPGSH